MPWGPKALRNSREEFVLEKIEYFKVNVWKELLDFWPLSIVVPGLLLSILWGAYAL